MTQKTTNIEWLDYLRALATFGVIVIHIASPTVKMAYRADMMNSWWIGNIIDSAVRFAVPVFLMLTGATLLTKEQDLLHFYKKRLTRVFIPFLFWMVVYWIFRWSVLKPQLQPKDFFSIIQWAIDLLLNEGISKHFWYFYMILVVYLFVPFVGKFLRKQKSSSILVFIIGWSIVNFFLRNMPMNMYSWSLDTLAGKLLGWFLHAGYLIVGYYLVNIKLKMGKLRYLAIAAYIISIAASALFTYVFSKNSQHLDLIMYGYLRINTIIQSVAIVFIFKDFVIKNNVILWIQREICKYSYGIYLAHVMVIGIFFNHGIYWKIAPPIVSIPLISILTLVTCYGIIFVLKKIPFGKYVAG